jgi:arsenite methyltransferase
MTEGMLALARRKAAEAGATNVEWLKDQIEAIPLLAETVDVVISNCVVNLSVDKPAVLAEPFAASSPAAVLGSLTSSPRTTRPAERAERGAWVVCIAGAPFTGEYEAALTTAGFGQVSVSFTRQFGKAL